MQHQISALTCLGLLIIQIYLHARQKVLAASIVLLVIQFLTLLNLALGGHWITFACIFLMVAAFDYTTVRRVTLFTAIQRQALSECYSKNIAEYHDNLLLDFRDTKSWQDYIRTYIFSSPQSSNIISVKKPGES